MANLLLQNQINSLFNLLFDHTQDETKLISQLTKFAEDNKSVYHEIVNIIFKRFQSEHQQGNKLKILNVIHSISKGKDGAIYVSDFKSHIIETFSECYLNGDNVDKVHLFKLYYSWKYIIPDEILEQLRINLNLDQMKEEVNQKYPGLIERYDAYNLAKLKTILDNQMYMNNNPMNNPINQGNVLLMRTNKKYGEDDEKTNPNMHLNYPKHQMKKNTILHSKINNNPNSNSQNDEIEKEKKQKEKIKRIKQIQEEIKKKEGLLYLGKKTTHSPKSTHSTNSKLSSESKKKKKNTQITQNINTQPIINTLNPFKYQMITQNPYPQIFPISIIQPQPIYQNEKYSPENILSKFILNSQFKLNSNFSFFSSISKFFYDTYESSPLLPSTDIGNELFEKFNNENEFKKIRDYSKNILFVRLRNECCICGYRNQYYDKFVQHLDIHYHYNYLKTTTGDKLLKRRPGCSKNNWITNSHNLGFKNKNNYTINALLYYHTDNEWLLNNQIYNENEKEDDNEELIYPVGKNEVKCFYCGDELKKKFFSKYHYWFYVNVIQIKNKNQIDQNLILIHEYCLDDYKQLQNEQL